MQKPQQIRKCSWCKAWIVYDPGVRMWRLFEAPCTYYCPQDRAEKRCQHIPTENAEEEHREPPQ